MVLVLILTKLARPASVFHLVSQVVKAKPAAPMMVAEDFVRPELALKKMKSVEPAPVFLNVLQTVEIKPAAPMMVAEEFARQGTVLTPIKLAKMVSVFHLVPLSV